MTRFAAIAALALLGAQPAAALTVGTYTTGNCYPFACIAEDNPAAVYQQVYNAAAFGGPVEIFGADFFQDAAGPMNSATYEISWYISATAYLNSSTTLADNLGAMLADWGSISVSGSMPAVFSISGPSFVYNPADGDLLLQVSATGITFNADYGSFFEADDNDDQTYRNFDGDDLLANETSALVTELALEPVDGAVPVPAAAPLLAAGLFGLGLAARRRKG